MPVAAYLRRLEVCMKLYASTLLHTRRDVDRVSDCSVPCHLGANKIDSQLLRHDIHQLNFQVLYHV